MKEKLRTANAKKNIAISVTSKIVTILLSFVVRTAFIQYLDKELLGLNYVFANIFTLLSMAELGLETAMNINFYQPVSENNYEKIAELMAFYKILYRIVALVITILGLFCVPILPYLTDTTIEFRVVVIYYIIFLISSALSYLVSYKSIIIHASQKNYLITNIEIVVKILQSILQIIIMMAFKSFFIYLVLNFLMVLTRNMLISHCANKNFSYINNGGNLQKDEIKKIFSDFSSVFLYKASWSLFSGTDSILISVLVSTVAIGLYSNYLLVISGIEGFIAIIFSSLNPSIGNLAVLESSKSQYKIFRTMQLVSLVICGVVCVNLYFLLDDFIVLWIGNEYLINRSTVIVLILNVFYNTSMRPVWSFQEGAGIFKNIKYIMLITAVLNLLLSIILGIPLGVTGILLATFISQMLTSAWLEPFKLFKSCFKVSCKVYYFDIILNGIIVVFSIFILNFVLQYYQAITFTNLIIKGFIVTVTMLIIYFIRYYKTEEFKTLMSKIKTA